MLRWQPQSAETRAPVVLVAGWISLVDGWTEVLRELAQQRPVVYLETREKHTASIERRQLTVDGLSLPRMAEDLVTIWQQLQLAGTGAVLLGSSLGANVILEALKHNRLEPAAAFLIGPNSHFDFPWWSPPLLQLPAWSYHATKHFVIWYLRTFLVNVRQDPAQMQRYIRTVKAAEPVRLKLSARAVRRYQVWPDLETIATPVAIAYAPIDTLHGPSQAETIAGRLAQGQVIRCPSNTYMHTAAVIKDLDRFLCGVVGKI